MQHDADVLVVRDHNIVVVPLSALAFVFFGTVGPEVHTGGLVPEKKRVAFFVVLINKVERVLRNLLIDRLHPLSC